MSLAASSRFKTLVAIQFFIGLAEASFYPAIQYVIGSWYKPDELAKRACLFHIRPVSMYQNIDLHDLLTISQTASPVGSMFSGFLQTVCAHTLQLQLILSIETIWQGVYNSLNGVHGLPGWMCG